MFTDRFNELLSQLGVESNTDFAPYMECSRSYVSLLRSGRRNVYSGSPASARAAWGLYRYALDAGQLDAYCKKKENIGNFYNNGAEYSPQKLPTKVLDHDFPLPENGKAVPYGVYDLINNEGYVHVGISKDTAQFAVQSIRTWWNQMGKERFPNANKLYITADGGGSNGSRCRLWKYELQQLSNEIGLSIEVSHFPPGTSKWNKIEHRLFSQISKNWRGRPLESLAVIVNLISSTTTKTGLVVNCGLDTSVYPSGIAVGENEYNSIAISRNDFHGEWNYMISPIT